MRLFHSLADSSVTVSHWTRRRGAEPETGWDLGAACSVPDCGTDSGAGATVPVSASATAAHLAPPTNLPPTSQHPQQVTSLEQTQVQVAPNGRATVCCEVAPDRPPAQQSQQTPSGAHRQLTAADRDLRDLFVAEAIDPELRGSIVAEIRTAVNNSSDTDIKR